MTTLPSLPAAYYRFASFLRKSIVVLLLFFCFCSQTAWAVQYWWRSAPADNAWTNPNNWSTVGFFSTTNSGSYPGPTDIATFGLLAETTAPITFVGIPLAGVGAIYAQTLQRIITIPAGETLTIAGTGSDAGGNANITIAAGATMKILPGATVQGAGGATRWNIFGTLELVDNGAVVSSGMGFYAGSTLLYSGAGAKITGFELIDGNTNLPYAGGFPGNVVMNKPTSVTLNANTAINGTFTLTAGTFNTGANTLTLNGTSSVAAGQTLAVSPSGTLVIQNNPISGTGNVTYTATSTLEYTGAATPVASGIEFPASLTLAGNLLITKNPGAIIRLPNNAVISGSTTINDGTLNGAIVRSVTFNGNLTINNSGRLVLWSPGVATINGATNTINSGEIWCSSSLVVNNPMTINGPGQLQLVGPASGGGGSGNVTGTGAITYNSTGKLFVVSNWAGTLDMPELPLSPTPMNGILDIASHTGAIGIPNDLRMVGDLNMGNNDLNLASGVGIIFEGAGVINAPVGKVKADNLNTVTIRRSGFNSILFLNSWVYRLVIDNTGSVNMTNPLTVGGGGLNFAAAGNLIVGSTTLTLEGNGTNHVTGGAGRIDATNAASVINILNNPQIDGTRFLSPVATLTTGPTPPAAGTLNGSWLVNNLNHANGSLGVSGTLTLAAGGTHTIAAGPPLSVLSINSFGRVIVPDGCTLTNNGTITVGGAGTLEIQGNGIVNGANTVNYPVTNAVLQYTGTVVKNQTTNEFPDAMGGSVLVQNTARVTLPTTPATITKTVAGTFTMNANGLFSMNGNNNSLVFNGPLTVNAGSFFESSANNSMTFASAMPSNISFGAPWEQLNNLTIIGAGNLTLTSPIAVLAGTLTLGAGGGNIISTPTNVLTVTNAAPGAVVRTSGFVDGPLNRAMTGAGAYDFPTGKGGQYLPFSINNPGSACTIGVEGFNANAGAAAGAGMGTPSTTEYWRTQSLAGAWTGGQVVLQPITAPSTGQVVGRYDGTVPAGTYTGIGGNVAGATITSTALTPPVPATSMFFLRSTSLPLPTTATSIVFTTVNTTDFSGGFTAASPVPAGYLVVRRPAASVGTTPTNGTGYSIGNTIGAGTVIAVGAGTTFSTTGLVSSTSYAVDVYSFNGAGASIVYSVSQLSGTVTTLSGAVPCTTGTIALPVTRYVLERNMQFTALSFGGAGVLSGAGTNTAYVNPGGTFTLSYTYNATPSGSYCPGCVTQIYLGINGVFTHCIASHVPQTSSGSGITASISAPATPGIYYVALNGSWDYVCYGSVGFSTNPVDAIATLIVGAPCQSNASDMVQPAFAYPAPVSYVSNTNGTVNVGNPSVWKLQVRDGGGGTDADFLPTVVTGMTINITDANNVLDRVALYDAAGTTKLGEIVAAPTITFSGLDGLWGPFVTAPDGGTVDFILKATYKTSPVVDNSFFTFTVTSVSARSDRSGMGGFVVQGPSVATGSNNHVDVVADRPTWTGFGSVQPTTVGLNPLFVSPAPVVAGVDINGNFDSGYTGTIQVSNPPSLVGGPLNISAVGGLATYTGGSSIRHTTNGTMQLTARIGVNTAASNSFAVSPALLSAAPTALNFGNVAVGDYVEQSFTLNGSTLPSNGILQYSATPFADISISATGGGAFTTVASIALNPGPAAPSSPGGSTLTQTIYVRYKPAANTTMSGQIIATFPGSVSTVVPIQGQGLATTVTTSTLALNFGSVFVGGSSDQLYSVSAKNISGPLTLTASAGVTISSTGTAPFWTYFPLAPVGNQITSQIITARFTPTLYGTSVMGTITHTNPFTTATVVSWQGMGSNPVPVALGFASSAETSSTATGGVPGGVLDATPFTVQAASFRADGVIANVSTASLQLQVSPLPGGTATFSLTGGTAMFSAASRVTLPNVGITWTNAPLAGGVTQAIVTLIRTSGDVLQSTQAIISINKGPVIPTITGISPLIIGSGSTVTISGSNFFSSTTVTFGGVPVASFIINSSGLITAVAGASGASGDVEVRAPGGIARTRTAGNSTDTLRFFGPPTITDFNPKQGKAGDIISIQGTNFDPSAIALFGNVQASSTTVNNPTLMNALLSPNGENGLVVVRTVGGTTTSSVSFSFIRPPDIQGLGTKFGTLGTEIIVTGANFKSISEVWLGPVQVTLSTVTVDSPEQLRFRVPATVSGPITVRNPAGVSISSDVFTYVFPPQITSMTPDSGSLGNQVIIRGQNFILVTSVTIAGAVPLQTFVTSTTQIVAVLGRGETGTAPVVVQTIGGVTASTIRFTFINPPLVSSIRPLVGGPRTMLTITGANFSAIDRITVGGLDVRSYEVISTTQIVAVVSDAGGSGNVQVFNRLGGAFSGERFTFYFPPNVQNFDPLEGSTGSTITIVGENFVNSTTTVVTIGGIPVTEFEVPMASQIIAVVSTGATGKVGVRTDGGYSESVMTFRFVPPRQVPPPRITSFSPDSASVGDIVTVEGLNFINVRQVRFNGVTIASFTVNSSTSLNFLLPQVTTGTIEVQTTTGTAIARRELVVVPPRVPLTALQRDSIAAVQIYNATGGTDWTRRSNWLTIATINRWQGVTVEGGRITQLALDSAGLRGTLPIAVSSLTALKVFRARGNSLEGAFPTGILLLPQLQELSLSNNQFTGEIPSGISSMIGLTSLRLDGNRFAGQIPPEMCTLLGLKEIILGNNQLVGTIPTCFARLPVLERLDLSNNRFSGGIPVEFAALTLLQDLLLNNNVLTNPLPRTIWSAAALTTTADKKNDAQITSTGLRSLTRLNISNNQMSGEIPTEIVNATALQEFIASNNKLSGSLPSTLGALVNLRSFEVSNNALTGQIPPSIRDLRLMERFVLSRNSLSGSLPLEIGQMVNLRVLALDSNGFSGAVPEAVTVLARLQILRLQSNQITTIPNVSGITPLTVLAVENNRLQFETLEPNVRSSATSFTFTYSPQDSIGVARDTAAAVGLPFALSSRLLSDNNVHTWFKNGREVPGVLGRALTFPAFARLDTGVYNARVTNSVVRGLTLVTRPVRVSASTAPVPSSTPLLLAPANQAVSVSLNATLEWLSVLAATSYDLQIALDATFNAPVLDTNVSLTQARLPAGTLKSFTGYVWRVRARNESGVSAWSEVRTFTTIDAGALVVVPTTDIGRSVVGRTKSGTVEITSVSDAPVQLVSARLEGTDINAFRIDTSATSVRDVTIPAFGKYQIRINFNPVSLGVKQVRLVLTLSNGGVATIERSGIVRGTPTFVDVNNLDFDTVLTNFAKVRNLAIANFGRDTIRINERLRFSATDSATAVFSLDRAAPQSPYRILPGDTLYLPVQALSSRLGETSGTISIITTQDTIVVNTKAFVREKGEQDVSFSVGIEAIPKTAVPGSRVQLRLYGIPDGNKTFSQTLSEIFRANNPSYSVTISMNHNVLVPSVSETKLATTATVGVYRIVQPRLNNDPNSTTFLLFECIAVAGETNTTDIAITERTWNDPNIFVSTSNGTFTANVSRAGGLRLIAPAAKTAKNLITALKPNPSSDETVVAYTVQQDESLEIAVFDARGAKVRTLLAATDQKAGQYTITLRTSDLASGQYRIMLIAPSGTVQEQLNVVR